MRLIFSLLVILVATSANADTSMPSIADQIRHPRGQQVAGNCTTTCQLSRSDALAPRCRRSCSAQSR